MRFNKITRLCFAQRRLCEGKGHGWEVPARKLSADGRVQIQVVCEDCGGGNSSQKKKADHPNWENYPVIELAPATYEDGCRCNSCIGIHDAAERRNANEKNRQEYRAQFRPAWLLTAWRMRQDRVRRFPDWAEFLEYQRSEQWRNIRQIVRERFDGRCAACNSPNGLEVHHRTYERVGMEEIGDLTLLCTECHSILHAEWNYVLNYVLDLPSPAI